MPPWKLWSLRGIAAVVLLIVFVAALCASGLASYFLAAWSASIPLLALTATLAFALVAWGGAWLGAIIWRATKRARFAAAFSGILTAIFVAALYFAVLRPSPLRLADTTPFDNTRYWQLPTGSRIAYSEYDPPAGVAARPEPIVFLHGGPGMRTGPFDLGFYSPFAAQGFRVYLLDQAGSGLSGFLPRVRDYSIIRAVQDLEAVRQQIDAKKMILIGHSWGSTLAASYMAKYPDRVAKVVFYSPGSIWNWSQEVPDFSRTDGGSPDFPSLRLLAALLLLDRNPAAAQNLLPQREAEELLVPFIAPTAGTLVCKGDSDKLPPFLTSLASGPHVNPGFNPYVLNALAYDTDKPPGDPHALLRLNHTPAIILFSECNYLPWSGALDYRKTMPNVKLYYIPKAGHFIQFEQPELMTRVILAFLLDQPDSISPYSGDADPRNLHN